MPQVAYLPKNLGDSRAWFAFFKLHVFLFPSCTDCIKKQKMPFDPLIDAGYKHGEFSRGPSAGLRVELQDHHSYRDSTPGPCRIDLVQCDAVLEL